MPIRIIIIIIGSAKGNNLIRLDYFWQMLHRFGLVIIIVGLDIALLNNSSGTTMFFIAFSFLEID